MSTALAPLVDADVNAILGTDGSPGPGDTAHGRAALVTPGHGSPNQANGIQPHRG